MPVFFFFEDLTFYFYSVRKCVHACMYVFEYNVRGGQSRALDLLELGLEIAVSSPECVLRTELCVLHSWADPPLQGAFMLIKCFDIMILNDCPNNNFQLES